MFSATQQASDRCSEQTTEGDRHQGVGEVTVVVEREERVVRGTDEDVQVWQHSAERTDPKRGSKRGPACTGLRCSGTNGGLRDWIHASGITPIGEFGTRRSAGRPIVEGYG